MSSSKRSFFLTFILLFLLLFPLKAFDSPFSSSSESFQNFFLTSKLSPTTPQVMEVILTGYSSSFEETDEDPYITASDGLQRLVFYLSAVNSNRNSVLIFEEPEAHTFPYYTKLLAEHIARDTSNIYFISTHNPYVLLSLIEKAPKDDVAVFITYIDDGMTKVRSVAGDELRGLMEYGVDVFMSIDELLGEV